MPPSSEVVFSSETSISTVYRITFLSDSRRQNYESLLLKSHSIHPVTSGFVSAIGIATGYGLGGRRVGVRFPVGA
jgi:hypothetical protein